QPDPVQERRHAPPAQPLDRRGQRAADVEVLGQQLDEAEVVAAIDRQGQLRPPADAEPELGNVEITHPPHPPHPPPPQPPPQPLLEPLLQPPTLPLPQLLELTGGLRAVCTVSLGPLARTPPPHSL